MNVTPWLVPPGEGLTTVTVCVPAVTRSLAGMVAPRNDVLPNAVGSGAPSHAAWAPGSKPMPPSAIVRSLLPAAADEGVTEESVGVGIVASVTVIASATSVTSPAASATFTKNAKTLAPVGTPAR
jgi:hypothetical protein